ncbi:Helix-turn-helix domain of resolvase [Nitrosospira multiformis]|uniref:Helix-turn-helix domain of resolvase n=1 Tax=Nitrosospira multiformis TaxID=1231 RepID=A0A1H8PI97_9PROT|nr:Helix-turn-helix domain of resolvase [Nitrosospira multiformis]
MLNIQCASFPRRTRKKTFGLYPPLVKDPRRAQFERSLIKERQREGIALARAKGVYKGRKPALDAEKIAKLREQTAAGANRTKLAKEFGISRETLYQYIR